MKYLLINQQTAEETLCEKVTIDGFDYYASKVEIRLNDLVTNGYAVWLWKDDCSLLGIKKVIATNNPNLDIPQVVDEVFNLSFEYFASRDKIDTQSMYDFKNGYNKSKETHPFSYEDAEAYSYAVINGCFLSAKEWKSQQPKKIYYTQTTQP